MRRVRLTITATAACEDDRWLALVPAETIEMVAGLPEVRDGAAPYAREGSMSHAQKDYLHGVVRTTVRYTTLARFKWWHFLLPDWALRRLVDGTGTLGWLSK